MSYKVLYRKYRPNNFDEIVGQKSIVSSIKNSIKNNKLSHAYIFTGPRGTGKTSTAKVLAKAINCINPENGNACGKCKNCIDFSISPDIIEIDAASNNGVDEIRELRNNITHAPAESKYKIYIIDEVHMLSPGAFNALLKTLEEPPSHAIFILATTEVYKVPITILSRCQRFDFQKIEKTEMVNYLKEICQKEHIDYDDEAIDEIYSLSEGCLRDALSILDQISKNEEKLTVITILNSYNIISNESIDGILKNITKGNVSEIINKIEEYENSGMNAQKLIKKMINHLETIAINIKLQTDKNNEFDVVTSLIKNLNKIYVDARINENTFTLIKLCFLEQIKNPVNSEKETIEQPKQTVERQLTEKTEKKVDQSLEPHEELSLEAIRINNCFADATKEALNKVTEIWQQLDRSKLSGIDIDNYIPVAASDSYVIFTSEETSLVDLFNIKNEYIEKLLKKSKLNIKVVAITAEKWKKEKAEYIKKIKNGEKYKIIEEPIKEDDSSKIKGQAENLFLDQLVEIA